MECKITTIIRYRTSDGIEHDTIEAALNHCSKPTYRMWTYAEDGLEETDSFSNCVFAHLPTYEAVKDFINGSADSGNVYEGIEAPGWYMWNSNLFTYIHVPDAFRTLPAM